MCGTMIENASQASSVSVLGTDSSKASGWIRSLGYAGIEDVSTLNVSDAIL